MSKNILITGASQGIGKAIVIELIKSLKDINLILIARNEEKLRSIFDEIKDNSPKSKYYVCDIGNLDSIKNTYEKIEKDFGEISVLINNAGVQKPIGEFWTVDFDLWRKNIQTNFLGLAFLTYLILPGMIKKGKGKIINFSGGGATGPRTFFSAYACAKTAVVKFTETLADELNAKEVNVSINAVAPGAINTNMLKEVLEIGENLGKEYEDAKNRNETGGTDIRFILDLIKFLISDKANGISGKLISAPWDNWSEERIINKLKNNKNFASLRKIDEKYFGEI